MARTMDRSDQTMRRALERAGLVPRQQPIDAPRFGERSAIRFTDPRDMTDQDIVTELTRDRLEAADIQRQLAADKDDNLIGGRHWRGLARKALRSRQYRIDQLTEAAQRRNLIAALPPDLAEKAIRAAERAAEKEVTRAREQELGERRARERAERAQRHAELLEQHRRIQETKTARVEVARMQHRSRAEMFVAAAHRLYAPAECEALWQCARELFPDSPAWDEVEAPEAQ